jgi:RNA polymerase sigma factor (sigma-70 family)
VFPTTHWSVIVDAGDLSSSSAEEALSHLCEAYWRPVYAYIRRRGHSIPDAEDLTQGFFHTLIQHGTIGRATEAKGRFRSFLLTCCQHFLSDEFDRATAQKRGGGTKALSLDAEPLEHRWSVAPMDETPPECLFDREWAQCLLENVMHQFESECLKSKKADFVDHFRLYLWQSDESPPLKELAKQFQISETAVRVTLHRMKNRFREILRQQVAATVEDTTEVDAELRHLVRILKTDSP